MITIRDGCLRDVSYVVAHMRASDQEEIYCQLPDGITNVEVAAMLVLPEQNMSYVACINDQPVAAFGFSPITVACVSVWAFGTDRMSRVVPAITDFITLRAAPGLISAGFRTMEARSITSHKEAHRWMESMGGLRTGPSFMYGKNDERFYLYRWTAKHYDDIRKMKQRWKRSDHVLCAETTEDARSPGSARAAQA